MRLLPTSLLILLISIACTSDIAQQSTRSNSSFSQTALPETIELLGVRDKSTNADSPIVLIILQGGPHDKLAFARDGRSIFRYLPNYQDYDVVYLHQSQTINPGIMSAGPDFAIEDAETEFAISAKILSTAINDYRIMNKRVLVVSHSFGSFITLRHLKVSGPIADQYAILAGRLDVNATLVDVHRSGQNARFSSDGVSLLPIESRSPKETEASRNDYRNGNLLKAAVGTPRYSSDLAELDLSNVTFIFASNDEAVGSLSEKEIMALELGGARVIETHDGHGDTIKRFIDQVADGDLTLLSP